MAHVQSTDDSSQRQRHRRATFEARLSAHDAEHETIDRVERAVVQLRTVLEAPGPETAERWARTPESARRRSPAAQAAIHCCLTAMGALLDAIRLLVSHAPESGSPESEKDAKTLNELTRTAGRCAFRAGLILTEPGSPPHSDR